MIVLPKHADWFIVHDAIYWDFLPFIVHLWWFHPLDKKTKRIPNGPIPGTKCTVHLGANDQGIFVAIQTTLLRAELMDRTLHENSGNMWSSWFSMYTVYICILYEVINSSYIDTYWYCIWFYINPGSTEQMVCFGQVCCTTCGSCAAWSLPNFPGHTVDWLLDYPIRLIIQ